MTPGMPKRYREKVALREVECRGCGHMIATKLRIPQCSKCGTYTEEK